MVGVRAGCGRGVSAVAAAVLAIGASAPSAAADPLTEGTWWYDALAITEAQAQATGQGVTVAVVDTMIHPELPELEGRLTSVGSFCGAQYRDSEVYQRDDGVSEVNREDLFVPDPAAGVGRDDETAGHASSMVALIAGSGDGGILGVAPQAQVRHYAVSDTLRPGTSTTGGDLTELSCAANNAISDGKPIAAAIGAAVGDDVDIINVSLSGGNFAPAVRTSMEDAMDAGIVVVVSAGNESGHITNPIGYPGTVVVGALTSEGGRSGYSNTGIGLTVSAPADSVACGEVVDGRWDPTLVKDCGTSGAAAITSGALALVKSKYPGATGNQLVQHLVRNTTTEPLAWNDAYGYGGLSLRRMLAEEPTRWADVNPLLKAEYPSTVAEDYPDDAAVAAAPPSPAPRPQASPSRPESAPSGPGLSSDPAAAEPGGALPWTQVTVGAVAVLLIAAGAAGWQLSRRPRSPAGPAP